MPFGDIIYPCIDPEGELIGFQMRKDLLLTLHMNNKFDLRFIRRAIRACVFMTRLVREGKESDFQLIQFKDGEIK